MYEIAKFTVYCIVYSKLLFILTSLQVQQLTKSLTSQWTITLLHLFFNQSVSYYTFVTVTYGLVFFKW